MGCAISLQESRPVCGDRRLSSLSGVAPLHKCRQFVQFLARQAFSLNPSYPSHLHRHVLIIAFLCKIGPDITLYAFRIEE